MRSRLDKQLVTAGLAESRSQAANLIKLGRVKVNGQLADKPSWLVTLEDELTVTGDQPILVSRAGYKLAGVAADFKLDFRDKIVLDVGASTGGFTEFALNNGAKLVYAVDVGTDQLHWKLRADPRVVSLEKTDIREVRVGSDLTKAAASVVGFSEDSVFPTEASQERQLSQLAASRSEENGHHRQGKNVIIDQVPDIILCDVSFISLRKILPHLRDHLAGPRTQLVMMMKPQFEATPRELNKGVIKNKTLRREIIHRFEAWLKDHRLTIVNKQDSQVAGEKGNLERFYLLKVN